MDAILPKILPNRSHCPQATKASLKSGLATILLSIGLAQGIGWGEESAYKYMKRQTLNLHRCHGSDYESS